MPRAIVLLAHGSPDPDWGAPVQQLGARIQAIAPGVAVRDVYLSHGDEGLAAALAELAGVGHREVEVIACVLSAGGRHRKRDIPALVERMQARFSALTLTLRDGALGEDARVIEAMAIAALGTVRTSSSSDA
ncbi:MAG: hypothetical protein KC636_19995 [Myxococcales bacterium]|nr:hypothetical protein [Myxococcales bacterium]